METTAGDAVAGDATHEGATEVGGAAEEHATRQPITDEDRATMVRAAVGRLGRDELRDALALTADPRFQAPKAVGNAINALRKHRDPAAVIGRVQYRPVVPYLAAAASDACLTRTIEVLGDHSDDPTREQLLAALDALDGEFGVRTVAVMLASVADADMPSSDLCFELLGTEPRFGLTGRTGRDPAAGRGEGNRDDLDQWGPSPVGADTAPSAKAPRGATPEQREARRLKKQKDAEERRKRLESARKAGEELRRARKRDRSAGTASTPATGAPSPAPGASVAPRLTRRAQLTPVQEEEFDRDDPWVAGVVYAWVPFDAQATEGPQVEGEHGKMRRCVVVAGSESRLLVRPGFSDGGVKSRDWKSVPLAHWRRSGFDQPTWIDIEVLTVPRDPDQPPLGWLSAEDWNALW